MMLAKFSKESIIFISHHIVKADSGTYYVIVNRTGKELKFGNMKTTNKLEVIKK